MNKSHRDSRGFGIIAVLLVLVVLAALVGAGWYVRERQHKAKTSKTPQNSNNGMSQSTPQSQKYLTIKEWGIQVKPAVSLPTLTYTIDTSDDHQWALLTFKDLPDSCAGFYHLNRAMEGQDLDGLGNTPEQLASINADSVKHVGDYYYYLGHGQGACSSETSVTDKQNTLIQQLSGDASHPNSYSVEAVTQ